MEDLKRYEKAFASVVTVLPQPVLIVDKTFRIRYANTAAIELFGYSRNRLLESNLRSIIDTDFWKPSADWVRELLGKSIINQHSGVLLAVIRKADDTRLTVQITGVRIKPEGNVHEMLLRFDVQPTKHDETIEKRIEAAMAGSELIHALNMLEDPVVILDDKWSYQFVNATGWKVLDRPKCDVLGHNVWELNPHLAGSEWQKAAFQAMKDQQSCTIEEYYPRSQRWYITKFSPSPHFLICHMEDVTALKQSRDINDQLLGNLEEAMEVYWSDENKQRRAQRKAAKRSE